MQGLSGPHLRPLGRGKILRRTFRRPGVRYLRLTVRNERGQKSSKTRRIVVSNAPSLTPTPAPPPAAAVSLEQPDGGTSYYRQFTNSLSTSPDYFPIGVWGAYDQTQANRDLDASAGINTYVWAGDATFLPEIRADGRFRVLHDEGAARTNVGSETAGWLLGDEWDMTDQSCPGDLNAVKSGLPSDGRMRYLQLGKGLALPPGSDNGNWWSEADEQKCWANGVDLASVDMYWFTDPWTGEFCCGYRYGDNVRNLRNADASDGQRHPNWGFVEAGDPWAPHEPTPLRSIAPNEMRSAVWHSIIAGARGIIYFQHSFRGPCLGHHHVLRTNCEGTRPMATSVNAQIKSLAPVLNAPFVTSGHSATGDVEHMVKWSGGKFYVFAGARNGGGSATFSIPCVGNATAVVEGESRSVPVNGGSFTDSFADKNAILIYRIDGGSTCGLPTGTAQPVPGLGGQPRPRDKPKRKPGRVGRLPRRISLRSGRLVVPVTCGAPCTVRSRLTMRRAPRRILLAARQRRFLAGRHKLVLRLSKRARHRVAGARRPFSVRLYTVILEPGGGRARRTQHLVVRRR